MATPIGNRQTITVVDVRTFLRDDPDTNMLLDDLEFSDEEIRSAHTLIVDKWNNNPPHIRDFTYDTFPYRYYLLMGIAAHLLWIAASAFRRNDLNYQIGGGAVADQHKGEVYQAAGDKLMEMFNDWMYREKASLQMSNGWGFGY